MLFLSCASLIQILALSTGRLSSTYCDISVEHSIIVLSTPPLLPITHHNFSKHSLMLIMAGMWIMGAHGLVWFSQLRVVHLAGQANFRVLSCTLPLKQNLLLQVRPAVNYAGCATSWTRLAPPKLVHLSSKWIIKARSLFAYALHQVGVLKLFFVLYLH